jgi:hypothetical protein
MRVACWITKATDKPTEYETPIAFPRNSGYMNAPLSYVIHTLPVLLLNLNTINTVSYVSRELRNREQNVWNLLFSHERK